MTVRRNHDVPNTHDSHSTHQRWLGRSSSFVCASTGIDVSGLSPGQTVKITGFSGQFANDFEVDPRIQSDIRVIED